MKARFLIISAVFCFTAFTVLLSAPGSVLSAEPQVLIEPQTVPLSKGSVASIKGTGFKHKEPIKILLVTPDDNQTDIGFFLKPAPAVAENGEWASRWEIDTVADWIKKLPKGNIILKVVDPDFNTRAETTVHFGH